MITSTDRVPGQLMPVGAHWWCNAGKPIDAIRTAPPVSGLAGLGGPLAVSGLGATTGENFAVLGFLTQAGIGYLIGKAIGRGKKTEERDAMIGALAVGVFGIYGVGVQAAVALGGLDKAKALHKQHSSRK